MCWKYLHLLATILTAASSIREHSSHSISIYSNIKLILKHLNIQECDDCLRVSSRPGCQSTTWVLKPSTLPRRLLLRSTWANWSSVRSSTTGGKIANSNWYCGWVKGQLFETPVHSKHLYKVDGFVTLELVAISNAAKQHRRCYLIIQTVVPPR